MCASPWEPAVVLHRRGRTKRTGETGLVSLYLLDVIVYITSSMATTLPGTIGDTNTGTSTKNLRVRVLYGTVPVRALLSVVSSACAVCAAGLCSELGHSDHPSQYCRSPLATTSNPFLALHPLQQAVSLLGRVPGNDVFTQMQIPTPRIIKEVFHKRSQTRDIFGLRRSALNRGERCLHCLCCRVAPAVLFTLLDSLTRKSRPLQGRIL